MTHKMWAACSHLALRSVAALVLVAGACNRGGGDPGKDGTEDLTITVETDKTRILEAEQQLSQRRQTVEEERTRLSKERADVADKIANLSKKDKKQRDELEAQQARLKAQEDTVRNREQSFEGERAKLEADKTKLLQKISEMTSTSSGMTIQQREEMIARREQRLADREHKVAEREKELADRETEVTRNLQTLSGVLGDLKGGMRAMAVPAAGQANANANKADVLKLQRQVKQRMETKGVLLADLPPQAKDLDTNAKTAISNKDFAGAQQALDQLGQMVDALKVDHAFVQAKFTRINRAYQGKADQLDEGQRKRVLALLDDVSDSFSDGRYDRANRKINQIQSLLEGGE